VGKQTRINLRILWSVHTVVNCQLFVAQCQAECQEQHYIHREDKNEQRNTALKFIVTNSQKPIINRDQVKSLPFTLVNEVLTPILADQNEEILVGANSQNFQYNPDTDLDSGDTLITTIRCGNIVETDRNIEVNLSGTIINQAGHRDTCSLYFFLWWDHTAISLGGNSFNYDKTLNGKAIHVNAGKRLEPLSDSVFELELYKKTNCGQQQLLGQGWGYMVFGRGMKKTGTYQAEGK